MRNQAPLILISALLAGCASFPGQQNQRSWWDDSPITPTGAAFGLAVAGSEISRCDRFFLTREKTEVCIVSGILEGLGIGLLFSAADHSRRSPASLDPNKNYHTQAAYQKALSRNKQRLGRYEECLATQRADYHLGFRPRRCRDPRGSRSWGW